MTPEVGLLTFGFLAGASQGLKHIELNWIQCWSAASWIHILSPSAGNHDDRVVLIWHEMTLNDEKDHVIRLPYRIRGHDASYSYLVMIEHNAWTFGQQNHVLSHEALRWHVPCISSCSAFKHLHEPGRLKHLEIFGDLESGSFNREISTSQGNRILFVLPMSFFNGLSNTPTSGHNDVTGGERYCMFCIV